MKKFINQLFIFFAIPILLISLLAAIFIYYISLLSVNCSLPIHITEIYVGDSHIKKAINDSLLTNGKNLGCSAETYYFSYHKIKRILAANDHIEKIYLGFSYHNLSSYFNNFIYGKGAHALTSKYFYMLPLNQKLQLLRWNLAHPRTFFKSIVKAGMHSVKYQPDFEFLGGYDNTFVYLKADTLSINKRIQHQYFNEQKPREFSMFNIQYLKKIISLCEAKNVELTVIKTPSNDLYNVQIPISYLNKYKKILYENKLTQIDLNSFALTDDCFTPDGDHLTKKGAMLTTRNLIKLQTAIIP